MRRRIKIKADAIVRFIGKYPVRFSSDVGLRVREK
jgi:hypothetical protein